MIIGGLLGAAIVAGAVIALQNRPVAPNEESLVNCEAHPNPAPHDGEFKFFLDVNGKHKNAANFELESISISDNGIALHSNVGKLELKGPYHPGLVDAATVGKNTIAIIPTKDNRDAIEQEVLLHVAVKLKDKKRNTITTTSAICQATIIHARTPLVAPPVAQPKPKPPIIYKNESGAWVEPQKKPATSITQPTTPTSGLTKSPSFFTKYQKYITDNVTQLSVVVKPEDLAGRAINGIEIVLASRGYTLPAVARTSCNVNDVGWYKDDWNCAVTGAAVRCSGATPLTEGKYSTIGIDFEGAIDNPPPFLDVTLYDASGTRVTGVGVEYKP